MDSTWLIATHAIAASVVLVLGPVNLLRRRRDAAHRALGRVWAAAILLTCATSFGIHPHGFSWLHGLSVFTLVSVSAGVAAIRRGDVAAHRANMAGCYLGTLIAFGFASLAPNRLIARMAVEEPVTLLGVVAVVLAGCALVLSVVLGPVGRRRAAPAVPTR